MQNFFKKQQSILNRLLHSFQILFKPFLFFILVSSIYGADLDINKILKSAQKENKHVMFFHHIPGCPYCKAMLDENFKDANILSEIDKNFIYVDIYTANEGNVIFNDFKGSYKDFSKHIGAFVYPTTIFMNNNGKIVYNSTGYRNIDEFLVEIKYIATDDYKTMDLESFITKLELEDF